MNDTINFDALTDSFVMEAEPCGYLPNEKRREMAVRILPKADIEARFSLADAALESGFAYFASSVFRGNLCDTCNACISIRYPVADFKPSNTQNKIRKLMILPAVSSMFAFNSQAHQDEHLALMDTYFAVRFPADYQKVSSKDRLLLPFQAKPNLPTLLTEVRTMDNVLMGAAISLETPNSLYAISYYYDPAMMHLQPGKQIYLALLQEAARKDIDYLYVGSWNPRSDSLRTKTLFRPYELYINSEWRRFDTPHPQI